MSPPNWYSDYSGGGDITNHIMPDADEFAFQTLNVWYIYLHVPSKLTKCRYKYHTSGQIITTSAEVTLNCGLVRESPQNPLNSGLGIIRICPDTLSVWVFQTYHVQLDVSCFVFVCRANRLLESQAGWASGISS